ncbi:MAG: HI1506-related protein [Rhizomicrobium sp.]
MAKADSKKKTAVTLPVEGQVVRINNRGGVDGYRRAGVKHPKGQVDHPFDRFDADQLQVLQDDPKLDVRVVDAPKAEETEPKK